MKLNKNRGSVTLIALALISMLTLLAVMAAERATNDIDLSYNQMHNDQAFYVADAGLTHAVQVLADSSWWRQGFDKVPFFEGSYSVTIIDSLTLPGLDDTVVIRSVGVIDGATSTIEVLAGPRTFSSYRYAAFGDESLFLENNACTDSYNSDSSTYAATQDIVGGDMGTNGTALLKNSVTVGGDLSTSLAGSITFENSAEVLGDTTSTATVESFELATDADYDSAQYNNSAPAGFIGTDYEFNPGPLGLLIKSNKDITLTSGTYYFTSLHLKNNADLILAPGAKVKIYVTGDILFENGTTFNENGIPGNLNIFTKGTSLIFKNNAEFRGTIYAPNLDFLHENNAKIYGSVIAKSITLKNHACIHYDRSLSTADSDGSGAIVVIAWREL